MAKGSLVSENFRATFMTPKKLVHFVSHPLPTHVLHSDTKKMPQKLYVKCLLILATSLQM